jgi:predicted MFS family arabinose efflux permease
MINATINLYKLAYSGLTRNIWLLAAVILINRSGTMVLAFLTLYSKHLGFSISQGGWVVAIYGLGSVVGAYIGGKLSDNFGFYRMQFTALFLGGILFIVLGQMSSYVSICICTFILSLVNESFRPANATAIAHYSNSKNRTQSFSLIRLSINLGFGIGIAVGGFLASIDYHLLFWVDGITNISAAFSLLLILPKVSLQQQRKPEEDTGSREDNRAGLSPMKDRTLLIFLGLIVVFAVCFFQLFTTVPVFFKEYLHMDEFLIGVVLSLNGVMIVLFEMLIVFKLEGKRPYLMLITTGTFLMGLAFMLLNIPLNNGFIVAILAMLLLTVAEMVAMPFMNSFYISRSTQQTRGQIAGMYTMAWSAAQMIGSSSGSFVAQKFGYYNLWWFTGALSIVAAIGFYGLLQKERK